MRIVGPSSSWPGSPEMHFKKVARDEAPTKQNGLNFYPIRNVLRTEIIMSKSMKRTILALLLTPLFSSCETAKDVGVATFRVIDAPAAYVRRHIDEGDGQVTETTTTTTETQAYPPGTTPGTATNSPPPSYAVQPPPP